MCRVLQAFYSPTRYSYDISQPLPYLLFEFASSFEFGVELTCEAVDFLLGWFGVVVSSGGCNTG